MSPQTQINLNDVGYAAAMHFKLLQNCPSWVFFKYFYPAWLADSFLDEHPFDPAQIDGDN